MAVLAVPSALRAQGPQGGQTKRVVVERFSGPNGASIRRLVVKNLSEQASLQLVSEDDMSAKAEELGFNPRRMREDEYAALAQELNVAAFVDGRVVRRRRRWGLVVRVRNGADGTRIATESWGGRSVNALGAVRRNAYARLEEHIAIAQPPATPPQEQEQPESQTVQGDPAWYQRGEPETPPGVEDGEDDDEDEDQDQDTGPRDERYEAMSVAFIGGWLSRSMSTMAQPIGCFREDAIPPGCGDTNTMAGLPEERSYDSAGLGHFEIGLRAEIYPGAIPEDQPVPWFGALVHFHHGVGLDSSGPSCGTEQRETDDGTTVTVRECPPAGEQVPVKTKQQELLLGARGRYRFWLDDRALRIRTTLGWGRFTFDLSEDDLMLLARERIIPPMEYSYVQIGLGVGIDVVPTYLAFGLDFGGRLGLGVGGGAKRIWGSRTTNTGGWKLGLELRSEMPYVTEGAFVGLILDYFRFTTDFDGQPLCVEEGCASYELWELWPMGEGDDAAGLPEPVEDNYLRLGLMFGYSFKP